MDDTFEMCIDCGHAEHHCACDERADSVRFSELVEAMDKHDLDWILCNCCIISQGRNCSQSDDANDPLLCGPCTLRVKIKNIREKTTEEIMETIR